MGLNAKIKEIKDKYKDEEFIPKYDQDFLVAAVPGLVEALEIAIANLKRMKEQDCMCTPEFGSATCGPCGTLKAIEGVLK